MNAPRQRSIRRLNLVITGVGLVLGILALAAERLAHSDLIWLRGTDAYLILIAHAYYLVFCLVCSIELLAFQDLRRPYLFTCFAVILCFWLCIFFFATGRAYE
jgi:hypothetical protein